MKNTLFKKGLVVGIILIILIPTTSSLSYNTKRIKKESKINNNLIQNGTVLTIHHIFPLLKGYVFIQDRQIKNIIKNIIIDLIFTGDTSLDEIQEILDSFGKTVKEIYLFAEIETSELTDGKLHCYPGNFRTQVGGYNAKGSYVEYFKSYELPLYGWNLKINGEKVTRDPGYFFGYYGHIRQSWEWHKPNIYYDLFTLDGYAILTFHGV